MPSCFSFQIFEKRKSKFPFSPLLHNNLSTPTFGIVKFLSRHFHTPGTSPPMDEIKSKCLRALDVLKFPPHPITGCNRKVVLTIYQSIIRSVLLFGFPVHGLARTSRLALLDTIRFCPGSFKTNPAFMPNPS